MQFVRADGVCTLQFLSQSVGVTFNQTKYLINPMTLSVENTSQTRSSTDSIRLSIEHCSLSVVQRVASLLDLDPDFFEEGQALPRGWQFILMGARTRLSSLRSDGFPGLGLPLPELGFSRLLLGSRDVTYEKNIPIGARVWRASQIKNVAQKLTKSGPMAIATIAHELFIEQEKTPAIVEEQSYFLLPELKPTDKLSSEKHSDNADAKALRVEKIAGENLKTVTPNQTMLFQYSALGFNSHKIHLDRDHARNVEGFPDLVVNGGLATLLLTEYLQRDLAVSFTSMKVRHLLPLFCDRTITMSAMVNNGQWQLKAYDDQFRLAIDMEVTPYEP
jgi:3-methylfumaryl-CoA hydratase